MNDQAFNFQDYFRLVAVDLTINLIWHGQIIKLAMAARKKLGFLLRAREEFSLGMIPSKLTIEYHYLTISTVTISMVTDPWDVAKL